MIEARELGAGGYDRVIISRTDLKWLFPHPPLRLLSPDFAWIPDTGEDDWGGIYHRHIVLPRAAVQHALGGWRMLTSGQAYGLIVGVRGIHALQDTETNTETWLLIRQ